MYKYLFGCRLELFYWEVKTEEEVEMSPGPWLPSELWVFLSYQIFFSVEFLQKKFVQKWRIDHGNGDVGRELEVASIFPLSLNIYRIFLRFLSSVSDWFVASDFTDVEIGVSRSAILQESGFEFLRNLAPFFSTICAEWWKWTARWQKPTFDLKVNGQKFCCSLDLQFHYHFSQKPVQKWWEIEEMLLLAGSPDLSVQNFLLLCF